MEQWRSTGPTVDQDGHFTHFKAIICQDDREAIEQAKAPMIKRLSCGAGDGYPAQSCEITHRPRLPSRSAGLFKQKANNRGYGMTRTLHAPHSKSGAYRRAMTLKPSGALRTVGIADSLS